jgi:spoIIIJ-associated protein
MSAKRTTIEKIASTIEEAIQEGLEELGLPREEVEIEILDEGSRGLFGLGSRLSRVRLTVVGQHNAPFNEPTTPEEDMAALEEALDSELEEAADEIQPVQSLMDDLSFQVVQETISELLAKMNFQAELDIRYGEADEMHSRRPILVDVRGQDLSMLIGKRAETLNAFQYIAGLIVSKELGRSVTLVIDIEGYRERRYNQIRQIARRMAEQAVRTGRRQFLEPMPANERRIAHIELRENPNVKTESTGEDPYRKVTIVPIK